MVSNDQRRRQLAREKFLRQQERREGARRRARTRNAIIASVVVAVLAIGGGSWAAGAFDQDDNSKADAAAKEPTPSASPSKVADPCAKPAAGKVKSLTYKKQPAMSVDTSADYTMKLATTCGDIPVTMSAKKAPHTVNSFDFLAGKGYFDHTKCHRLTTAGIYVLQCGDPKGTGAGGPGYTIPDENLKDKSLKGNVYPAGTVAMANQFDASSGQGKDSGGSQFFLVYQDSQLPPNYTPFGTISSSGMKVLKKIAAAGESTGQGDGAPNATVVVNKATVTKS